MKYLFFLAISSFIITQSIAGDRAGNGSDLLSGEEYSAWFLGNRSIYYCFIVSADFGVSREIIVDHLESAFKTWKDYIEEKKINDPQYGNKEYNSDSKYLITANSKLISSCDGKEDLKFYFGVRDKLTKYHEKKYNRPIGFAQKTDYDGKTGWGKGFIWIAPPSSFESESLDWNSPYRLHGLLLHEIGHVLGVGHIENTIMDPIIGASTLFKGIDEEEAKRRFTQIDLRRELFLCEFCSYSFIGTRGVANESRFGFEELVGREPVGEFFSSVSNEKKDFWKDNVILSYKDDLGEYQFPIEFDHTRIASSFGETPIFKKALSLGEGFYDPKWLTTNSVTYLGRTQATDGRSLLLVINRNEQVGPYIIQVIDGIETRTIFISETIGSFK